MVKNKNKTKAQILKKKRRLIQRNRVFPETIIPVELWSLIIKELSDIKDISNLLLTCKLFNSLVYECINTIYSLRGINIKFVEKLSQFKKLENITRINNVNRKNLDKLTVMKLSWIDIVMDEKYGYELFLKQNEQLKYFNICTSRDHIIFLHNNLLVQPKFNNRTILLLNELNNSNIKMLYFVEYDTNIGNLDTDKYKILLNRTQFGDELFMNYILTKPVTIGFHFCAHNIERYYRSYFIKHKIEYIYDSGNLLEFERMLENVKFNFPRADVSGIIYNRTFYLKRLLRTIEYTNENNKSSYITYKEDYEIELSYNLIDKPYKII